MFFSFFRRAVFFEKEMDVTAMLGSRMKMSFFRLDHGKNL